MRLIKPIQTEYNGYLFRSRLEARWAVFFDTLNIKYEYEPEGYELPDGTKYLPDFYLPDNDCYVEVKGKNRHLEKDLDKIYSFVCGIKKSILILSRIPDEDKDARGLYLFPYIYFQSTCCGEAVGCHAFFRYVDYLNRGILTDHFVIGHELPFHGLLGNRGDNELIYEIIQAVPGCDDCDPQRIQDEPNSCVRRSFSDQLEPITAALKVARRARFEYGETPKAKRLTSPKRGGVLGCQC